LSNWSSSFHKVALLADVLQALLVRLLLFLPRYRQLPPAAAAFALVSAVMPRHKAVILLVPQRANNVSRGIFAGHALSRSRIRRELERHKRLIIELRRAGAEAQDLFQALVHQLLRMQLATAGQQLFQGCRSKL